MRTGNNAVKRGVWMWTRLPAPLRALFTATLGTVLALGALPALAAPPPAPVVLTPANGSQTSNPRPPTSGTAVAPGSVTVYLDGTPTGTITVDAAGNWAFTPGVPLADGAHTVFATVELGGETSSNSNTNTFLVDTLAPDTFLTSVPAALTSSSSATFSFSSNEGGVSYGCSLDGSAYALCSTPTTFVGLSDGTHTLAVRATDGVGNVDPTPASYTWTVDTAAPDTTIVTAPPALANTSSATFVFSSNEGGVTYGCSLNGSAFAPCSTPITFTGLAGGAHTLAVRATDGAGNVDATPASYAWTVDAVAPAPPVISAPAAGTSMAALVAVSGSAEAGSTVAVFIDGAPVGTVTASGVGAWSFTPPAPLAAGPHTVQATATDAAGNASAASAVVNFSVAGVAAAPAAVPSLGTWGLLGLTSLLGLWGLGALRRRD